jgi:pimeloyl-ACP methyl ester carboxylesterase
MTVTPAGRTVPGITHHRAEVNGTTLHYVAAGTTGSPILLVHGFPETWWAFHKLIPLLAPATASSPSTCAASATPTTSRASTTARPRPRTCTS